MPAEDDKDSPIGRSFYNTYQVTNKTDLESKLNSIAGLEYEWTPEGSLTVITEPIPGEYHPSTLWNNLVPQCIAYDLIQYSHFP